MKSTCLIALAVMFFGACQSDHKSHQGGHDEGHDHANENLENMKPGMIHNVYFWVKEGTSEADIQAFEKGLETLGTCPQIQHYFWGPPSPTEQRGVVDNSYSYSINVFFETLEDQNAYQEEPIHLAFIENHQAIWEKVIVYDNDVR